METITYQSFRKEAEEQAKNALEEAISNGATDREKAEEMARDYLHESVDSHEWIIYTGRAWEIVSLIRGADSRLWDEAHDQLTDTDGGKIREGEDLDNVIIRLAYWLLFCEAESWLSSVTIYSAGWNMPGYMPDSDPAIFASFEGAKAYIIDAIERDAEESYEEATGDKSATPDHDAALLALANMHETFSAHVGGYVYWVTED